MEHLFQMTENNYRSLITLLFESDKFIKEITENLAFYYPITTQEGMLSVSCEKNLRKFQKTFLQLKHRNKMNVLRH